jgi:CheY-like chemotaxis protein
LLLVEDGPANGELIAGLLSRWGLSVQTAAHSLQALEILRGQGRFHVVLADRHLPEKDGLWLAAEIRKIPHCQHLPLILLTNVQQISDLPPAHTAGFAGYATKPVLPSRLQKALVLAMQGLQGTEKIIPVSAGLNSSRAARDPLRLSAVDENVPNPAASAKARPTPGI